MIKSIFFDLDGTLTYTNVYPPEDPDLVFGEFGRELVHYAVKRPKVDDILAFTRDLVGVDEVFILTNASRYYAECVNRCCGLGFESHNIYTAEEIEKRSPKIKSRIPNTCLADFSHILIDDMDPYWNSSKMIYLGIDKHRYLTIPPFDGTTKEDGFEKVVMDFLTEKKGAKPCF